MTGFIKTYADPGSDPQTPFDVAVVMPTIGRASIARALDSIFAQDSPGRVQTLIGLDQQPADPDLLDRACANRPPHHMVQVFWPGYSTSVRHGGLSPDRGGGVLRCVLSHLANSRFVAYLDDDNWWHPSHLRTLRGVLDHADWAFSLRWFVHPTSLRPICIDRWESLGPGLGVYAPDRGGFVDTNCLMLNKLTCEPALALWNRPVPNDPRGMSADRSVFDVLRRYYRGAGSGEATVFYVLSPDDIRHAARVRLIGPVYDRMAPGGVIESSSANLAEDWAAGLNQGRPAVAGKK